MVRTRPQYARTRRQGEIPGPQGIGIGNIRQKAVACAGHITGGPQAQTPPFRVDPVPESGQHADIAVIKLLHGPVITLA